MIDISDLFPPYGEMVRHFEDAPVPKSEPHLHPHLFPPEAGGVVLIVDDSEADRLLLARAFAASGVRNKMHFLASGRELLDYLEGRGKFANRSLFALPRIVLLDLKMPAPNGLEILQWKEGRTDLQRMLWVAMSNFDSTRTINEAYAAGASTFLTKPLHSADIKNLVESFDAFWALSAAAW